MNIFPAIDLYNKQAVRLYKGDYNQKTVYSDNPIEILRDFEKCGAKFAHVVDLEGAKTGETPNFEVIKDFTKNSSLFIEVGGGIRTMEVVNRYLDAGVKRVILGTSALNDRNFLLKAIKKHGEKIAVGVDIKDRFVAIKGWIEKSNQDAFEFLKIMQDSGVKTVICTDISKDGAMKGTNHELYSFLSKTLDINIIASGGVSCLDDIVKLKALNLYGAIIGKAYYTGAINLQQAIEVAK